MAKRDISESPRQIVPFGERSDVPAGQPQPERNEREPYHTGTAEDGAVSIRAMTAVWEHSPHKGSELLLLLAIADYANDNGEAWPSQETLAAKMRMSVRQVRRLAQALEVAGAITMQRKRVGPKTQITYQLPTGQDVRSQVEVEADIQGELPDIAMSAEPSIEPPEDQGRASRKRVPVWDALEQIVGKPKTRSETSDFAKTVHEIQAVLPRDVDQETAYVEMRVRRRAFERQFPGATFTHHVLRNKWGSLGLRPVGAGRNGGYAELPDGETF